MCMKFFFRKISDLEGEEKLKGANLSDIKRKIEILIIDDEEFSYFDTLKKHEYCLTQKKDLSDLKDAEAYHIILCDIRGVGAFLESNYAGAYLIKQLKEKYPNKTIIAYSANDYNAEFQQYLQYADEIVPKGSYALEDWTALLDRLIKQLSNPVKIWEKARNSLLDAGVSTIDIAKYESDYVKAVQKGEFESFRKLYEKKKGKGAEIMGGVFKLLSGIIGLIGG